MRYKRTFKLGSLRERRRGSLRGAPTINMTPAHAPTHALASSVHSTIPQFFFSNCKQLSKTKFGENKGYTCIREASQSTMIWCIISIWIIIIMKILPGEVYSPVFKLLFQVILEGSGHLKTEFSSYFTFTVKPFSIWFCTILFMVVKWTILEQI